MEVYREALSECLTRAEGSNQNLQVSLESYLWKEAKTLPIRPPRGWYEPDYTWISKKLNIMENMKVSSVFSHHSLRRIKWTLSRSVEKKKILILMIISIGFDDWSHFARHNCRNALKEKGVSLTSTTYLWILLIILATFCSRLRCF